MARFAAELELDIDVGWVGRVYEREEREVDCSGGNCSFFEGL